MSFSAFWRENSDVSTNNDLVQSVVNAHQHFLSFRSESRDKISFICLERRNREKSTRRTSAPFAICSSGKRVEPTGNKRSKLVQLVFSTFRHEISFWKSLIEFLTDRFDVSRRNSSLLGRLAVGFSRFGSQEELKQNPLKHLLDVRKIEIRCDVRNSSSFSGLR